MEPDYRNRLTLPDRPPVKEEPWTDPYLLGRRPRKDPVGGPWGDEATVELARGPRRPVCVVQGYSMVEQFDWRAHPTLEEADAD